MTKDVLQKDLLDYKAYFLINLSILVANYDYWSNVVVPIKKGLRV
jgi:predicted YcjX-like family ATPase